MDAFQKIITLKSGAIHADIKQATDLKVENAMSRDCKKHPETFCMDADLATSAIVSYAMGYVVEKYPAAIEKVCTWIKRHWDAFDYWQQVNIIDSCKFHNHHQDVTKLIGWMEQNIKSPLHNEALPQSAPMKSMERKLCR